MNTKTMFAISALCAAVALTTSAVESDIVGYMGKDTGATKHPSFGACFVPVAGGDTYKLKDLIPTNFDPDNDVIQVLNPTTLAVDGMYVYMSKEIADAAAEADGEPAGAYDGLIGWWDAAGGVGEEGAEAGNVDINVGQAFLGLCESGEDITFTSSGAVNGESLAVSCGTTKHPFFASMVPTTIKLGAVLPTNFDPDNDVIQVLNPATLNVDGMYVYMSKEIADAAAEADGEPAGAYDGLIGWWDAAGGVGEEGAEAGNVDVSGGDAFLGLFESGNSISFAFPSPITE